MKKFKKVLSFVAACTMAMAVMLPFMATADITFTVTPPSDWTGVCLWPFDTTDASGNAMDSVSNADVMPAEWPGAPLTDNGDGSFSITLTGAAATDCVLASADANQQSGDITGLIEGSYVFTDAVKGEDGKFTFSMSNGSGESTTTDTSTSTEDTTPATGDVAPIAAVAVVGIVSVVVVLATRKKAIA